jgi:hypothetical protein
MANSIHLQGIGRVHAVKAGEVKVGTVLVFNYGYCYTVTGVEQAKSGKSVKLTMRSHKDNGVWEQTKRIETLIGVGS